MEARMANFTGPLVAEAYASIDGRYVTLGPVADLYFLQSYTVGIGFVILSSFMIMLMQLGWAQMEAGISPVTEVQTIFMKNIADSAVSALSFFFVGFSLAYGTDTGASGFSGSGTFALTRVKRLYVFYTQFVYLVNASTCYHGAVAGRMRFVAYLVVSFVLASFVYPIAAHWVWSPEGWLHDHGIIDYGGASVVDVLGGAVGLAGTLILGPRFGFTGKAVDKTGKAHNKPMAASGAYLVWMGWMAFLALTAAQVPAEFQAEVVGRIASVSLLSSSSSILTVFALRRVQHRPYDLVWQIHSIIAGMVSVTACCASVELWAAIVIGAVSAVVLLGCSSILRRLKVDDPLDSISIHLGCGMWSLLAAGIFSQPEYVSQTIDVAVSPQKLGKAGIIYGGGVESLGVQLAAGLSVFVWAFVTIGAVFLALKRFGLLRISREAELGGIDLFKHNSSAYPAFAVIKTPLDPCNDSERESLSEFSRHSTSRPANGSFKDTSARRRHQQGVADPATVVGMSIGLDVGGSVGGPSEAAGPAQHGPAQGARDLTKGTYDGGHGGVKTLLTTPWPWFASVGGMHSGRARSVPPASSSSVDPSRTRKGDNGSIGDADSVHVDGLEMEGGEGSVGRERGRSRDACGAEEAGEADSVSHSSHFTSVSKAAEARAAQEQAGAEWRGSPAGERRGGYPGYPPPSHAYAAGQGGEGVGAGGTGLGHHAWGYRHPQHAARLPCTCEECSQMHSFMQGMAMAQHFARFGGGGGGWPMPPSPYPHLSEGGMGYGGYPTPHAGPRWPSPPSAQSGAHAQHGQGGGRLESGWSSPPSVCGPAPLSPLEGGQGGTPRVEPTPTQSKAGDSTDSTRAGDHTTATLGSNCHGGVPSSGVGVPTTPASDCRTPHTPAPPTRDGAQDAVGAPSSSCLTWKDEQVTGLCIVAEGEA